MEDFLSFEVHLNVMEKKKMQNEHFASFLIGFWDVSIALKSECKLAVDCKKVVGFKQTNWLETSNMCHKKINNMHSQKQINGEFWISC